jgi:hypothetical protein
MGDFWHDVDKRSKSNNQNPVEIGEIISLQPLTIGFQGLDLSVSNGDKIYLNNLLLDENKTFTTANPITCSDGTITENHTDIINDITQWLTSIHQRFILSVGDNVAVQRLGNNMYIVLEKVQQIE